MSGHYIPFAGSTEGGLNNPFPFPLITKAQWESQNGDALPTGPGSISPFTVSLADAVRWWWQVDQIEATVSRTFLQYGSPCFEFQPVEKPSNSFSYSGRVYTADNSISYDLDLPTLIEAEAARMTGIADPDTVSVDFELCDGETGTFDSPINNPLEWQIGGDNQSFFVPPVLLTDSDPSIAHIVCSFSGDGWSSLSDSISDPDTLSAELTTPWFSKSLTLYKAALSETLVTNTISVSLRVSKVRPYGAPAKVLYPHPGYTVGEAHPHAGDPIYNTSTGATLLDPVTGFPPA